jgi:hypothetical protein
MGIERARVMEMRSGGAGYLIDDRLVLTAGRGAGPVRPAGAGTWVPATPVWRSSGAALLELDDPSALMMPSEGASWGRVTGRRAVAVTAMGFPPVPHDWPRDPERFVGHVVPGDGATLAVTGAGAGAMTGAALFAGAELVGVLLAGGRAVPAAALADDPDFVDAVGGLALVDVSTPASAFPIF